MSGAKAQALTRSDQRVIVVGAGIAGVRAAEAVRASGFPGQIMLIGDEPHPPYDRPPLSKAVLRSPAEEARIGLVPESGFAAAGIDVKLGRAVAVIDRGARAVILSDGERIAYDRLVLATGSAVRPLPELPPGMKGVHYLRDLDDARSLRRALQTARNVAIIGAGVIGLEVAATAIAPHRQVTVIEAGQRAMARAASPAISNFVATRHREAGVDLRFGVAVAHVGQGPAGPVLTLSDGATLTPDVIVVGIGVTPRDKLAREAGLEVQSGGTVVDGHGMTSDPYIYAAGEGTVHFNGRQGGHDRQETWAHAAAHGEHVGRALVTPGMAYEALRSYWTDQYDFTLNVLGCASGERDIVRGDPAEGRFLVFHLVEGRVVGLSAVNAARELRAAKGLIDADLGFDPAILIDPATDLRTLR